MARLSQIREDYRAWSDAQLAEGRRTAEQAEEGVLAVSTGTSGRAMHEAAEIERLQLAIHTITTQGELKRTHFEELLRREEERFEEHKRRVLQELDQYAKDVDELAMEAEELSPTKAQPCESSPKASVGGG